MVDAASNGKKHRLWGITEEEKSKLNRSILGNFYIIRNAIILIMFTIRRIWRNLRAGNTVENETIWARFRKKYPAYMFEFIDSENLEDFFAVAQWCKENGCGRELQMEKCAIAKALQQFDAPS